MAEATLTTGDAPRARALLEQLTFSARTGERVANSSDAVGTDQPSQAVEHAMPAIVPGDPVPSERHTAHTHLLHAEAALILDDYDQAAAYAQQILDDPAAGLHHTALAHRLLARIDLRAWNLRQADQHLHNATTAAQQCPDQRCMVHLLLTRAELAELKAVWSRPQESPTTISTSVSLSQYTEAAHQKELAARERIAAASLATDLKDPLLQAHAIVNTAPGEALALYRTLGDRRGEAHTLVALADGLRMRGDVDGAQDHATQALTLFRTLGNRRGEAEAHRMLAEIVRLRGDVDGAQDHATQALTLFRTLGNRQGEAEILLVLAAIARVRGDVGGADKHATQALTLFHSLRERRSEAETLRMLADNARRDGRAGDGRRQMEEAAELYEALGLPKRAAQCRQELREW
ncbi:tetratricopeptide repeat protein [Streptomyces sp. NPDC047009]|uniref:tetratricopeptide repeat protein n=1 Tax=Streptomyces sp. NPDC047009 TaxID=3154496 RepID=UPI003405B2D5